MSSARLLLLFRFCCFQQESTCVVPRLERFEVASINEMTASNERQDPDLHHCLAASTTNACAKAFSPQIVSISQQSHAGQTRSLGPRRLTATAECAAAIASKPMADSEGY